MRLKLLSIFAASLLIAACGSTVEETGSVAGDGGSTGLNGQEGFGNDRQVAVGDVAPGSEQDFVVNVGDRVFFGFDRSDLTEEGRTTLRRQAEWLRTHGNTRVTIEGHADERGTREYNLGLGERRANSVRSYLVSQGIPRDRIQIVSYGKERPAVVGSNEDAWQRNRRAVTAVN